AGTVIFCLSVILWAMTYYPRLPEAQVRAVRTDVEPIARIDTYNRYANSFWFEGKPMRSGISVPRITVPAWVSPADADARLRALAPNVHLNAEEEKEVGDTVGKAVASAQLRYSLAGRFGHLIEPAIRPLGFDWKMGVGLVGAF